MDRFLRHKIIYLSISMSNCIQKGARCPCVHVRIYGPFLVHTSMTDTELPTSLTTYYYYMCNNQKL